MTEKEEIEYYQNVLSEALNLLCDALGVDTEHYDRDQADGECYLDCFKDAAGVIEKSGIKWNDDEAEFV